MKHGHCASVVLIVAWIWAATTLHAEATTNSADLSGVLGSAADWKTLPAGYVLGASGLKGPPGVALNLESSASKAAPSECLMSFRLKPAASGAAYVNVQMACAERADKTQQALTFAISAAPGQKYVGYGASVQGGKAPPQPL